MVKWRHFYSFWYYKDAWVDFCNHCGHEVNQHLLRHRVFYGFKKPLLQVKTKYALICPNCGYVKVVDGEGRIAPYISRVKSGKADKYLVESPDRDFISYVHNHLQIKEVL